MKVEDELNLRFWAEESPLVALVLRLTRAAGDEDLSALGLLRRTRLDFVREDLSLDLLLLLR